VAGDCGGGGHHGADQVGAAVAALAALEVAVAGAGAAFVGGEDVGVHADAHTAAGVPPLETGGDENLIETFFFGLGFYAAGAGNYQSLLDGLIDVLAFDEVRGGAEIVDAGIGAAADKDAVDVDVNDGSAGFQSHVLQGALGGFLVVEIFEVVGIGNASGYAADHSGIGAPGDLRSDLFGLQFYGDVEFCAFVAGKLLPAGDRFVKFFAAGNECAAFEIFERGFVWRDHSGAGASFHRHVADGHAAFHAQFADCLAGVFDYVAGAATDSDFSDDGENNVFCSDTVRTLAVHHDVHGFGFRLDESLGGENVFDFAGADTESESAERAVRGGVTVAADDGLPGLSDAELRADYVDDALVFAVHVKQTDAEFFAILFESFKLQLGVLVEDGQGAIGGGDGMVHHGEGEIGATNFTAFGTEPSKGLRGSAFVDQVAVNVDDGRLAGLFADDVVIPDFLIEGFGCVGHFVSRFLIVQRSRGILALRSASTNQGRRRSRVPKWEGRVGKVVMPIPWGVFHKR
jgi:hypothetical protein